VCNCAGEKVNALTLNPQTTDRLPENRRRLPRLTVRHTLAASLICGAIAGTGIKSPAQTSQPDYMQQTTPPTRSRIDRRRIGPVILAAIGPAGLWALAAY
jgi:hypothetical protein